MRVLNVQERSMKMRDEKNCRDDKAQRFFAWRSGRVPPVPLIDCTIYQYFKKYEWLNLDLPSVQFAFVIHYLKVSWYFSKWFLSQSWNCSLRRWQNLFKQIHMLSDLIFPELSLISYLGKKNQKIKEQNQVSLIGHLYVNLETLP